MGPAIDKCEWVYDPDLDKWDTTCDNAFQFFDGAPIENGFEWCPYCGKELIDKGTDP